jgi:hypothetical protein
MFQYGGQRVRRQARLFLCSEAGETSREGIHSVGCA